MKISSSSSYISQKNTLDRLYTTCQALSQVFNLTYAVTYYSCHHQELKRLKDILWPLQLANARVETYLQADFKASATYTLYTQKQMPFKSGRYFARNRNYFPYP